MPRTLRMSFLLAAVSAALTSCCYRSHKHKRAKRRWITACDAFGGGRPAMIQRLLGCCAFSHAISEPVWRTEPSWYLVTTEDKMIPPDAFTWYVACSGQHKSIARLVRRIRTSREQQTYRCR